MQTISKRILSLALAVLMTVSLLVPSAFAAGTVENSPYKSYAAIGDSIAAGYGPLMGNNTWENFEFDKPPAGAYPNLLTKDLRLDLEDDFNSLLCIDQRVIDIYYALGGDVDPVVDPSDLESTVDYADDARAYHGDTYMDVLEEIRSTGEGARRIKDSELITIQIGLADLAIYPVKRTNQLGLSMTRSAELVKEGLSQYENYYPKLLSLIHELNPDAKVLVLSLYNPFDKFEVSGNLDTTLFNALKLGVSTMNTQLKMWAAYRGFTYVDITGLGSYVDAGGTITSDGELLNKMMNHENHPGASGHQYVEEQILTALKLKRASAVPSTDEEHSYLAFTSDTHVADNGYSTTRLDNWLDTVSEDLGGVTFDAVGFCGDIGADNLSSAAYANKIQLLMNTVERNAHVLKGIYTVGNHEYSPGKYATQSDVDPYSKLIRVGEAADTDDYSVYCFGAGQWDYRFNDADIQLLDAYLAQADKDEPVIILSHFPLHKIPSRTIGNAGKVIDVLNKYPNVLFLWGHNHTESDSHYGKVYTEDLDGTPIHFTYASAGCMSDADYSGGSGRTTVKGLVAAIDDDGDYTLTYYDKNYQITAAYLVNINDGSAVQTYPTSTPTTPNFDGKTYYKTGVFGEGQYVIAVDTMAMNSQSHTGYVCVNNDITYTYTGLNANAVAAKNNKISAGITEDNIWTVKQGSLGYTIQNKDGLYLTANYYDAAGASLQLSQEPGDNGVWTYSDNHLRNTATGKQLNFEVESDVDGVKQSGETNLFDIRTDADDTISLYSTVAGTDNNDDYEVVTSFEDGAWYIISAEGKAMTGEAHEGFTNKNQSDLNYSYSGLKGGAITIKNGTITSGVTSDMLWEAEKVDGGYALKNKQGLYLNASYTSDVGDFTGVGKLFLSETPEVWVIGSGTLQSSACGKQLNYQNPDDIDGTKLTGSANFFTVRSSAKDTVTVFRASNGDGQSVNKNEYTDADFRKVDSKTLPAYHLVTSSTLEDGARIVMAYGKFTMGNTADPGYENKDDSGKYYHYAGLNAKPMSASAGKDLTTLPTSDFYTVWTVEKDGDYYRFKNSDGKYMAATYAAGSMDVVEGGEPHTVAATGIGNIYLTNVKDNKSLWTFSNDSGKATLQNKDCGKKIVYNNGGNISGTCLSPDSKDKVSVFTVRTGTDGIYLYQEAQSTTASFHLATTASLENGAKVVFAYSNYYMGSKEGVGYKNHDGNSYYSYSGLSADALGASAGTGLAVLPNVTDNMTWTVETVDGGYRFKNAKGKYLSASYDNSGSLISVTENDEFFSVPSTGIAGVTLLAKADDSCVWTYSTDNGNATLTNVKCGKQLTYNKGSDVSGTCLSPDSQDKVSVFTVRTSKSHGFYIYTDAASKVPNIADGGKYVIVSQDGFGLSATEGVGYNDHSSNYRYEGMEPVSVTEKLGKITTAVTKDMVWTVTKGNQGYMLQNADGKYLNSFYDRDSVIHVFLSDTPEEWLYIDGKLQGSASGKQLSHETNNGSASIFTLRSTGQSFSFYAVSGTETATCLYTATAGGGVSTSRETVAGGESFSGSIAIARSGYSFDGWYCGDQPVSTTAAFVPDAAGVYEARFTEKTAKMSYVVKLKGTGDASVPSLTAAEEVVGVVSGDPAGSTANQTDGYTFLYWTSDEDGRKIISRTPNYLPKRGTAGYASATYYAWFEKEIVCHADVYTTLDTVTKGSHDLRINGTDCGKFVFTESGDGWTIYSVAEKKFVTVNSDGALTYSTVESVWTYDASKGFSTKVSAKLLFIPITRTYYLTTDSGVLAAKTSAASSTALFDVESVGYPQHTFAYAYNGDKTHTGKCTVCGYEVIGSCDYNGDICKLCKAHKSDNGSVRDVEVSISSEKVYQNVFYRLFGKYTMQYAAAVTPTAENVTVSSVSISPTRDGTYASGSTYTSDSEITELWIKVVDSNGTTTAWHYVNGDAVIVH